MKISACICTKNEEKMLPGLLDNLLGRVDEIVIVDGGSTDNTIDIAERFTDSIYTGGSGHPDGDRHLYVENARNDWLLVADADERFCPAFLDQLKHINGSGPDGYWIARRNYYEPGKYFTHIVYPDYQLRLFDRRKLSKINDQIHSRPVIDGWLFTLPEQYYIEHLDPIFSDHHKYKKYVELESKENPGKPSYTRALYKFVEWMGFALKRSCWRDGPAGVKMAYSQALYNYWLYRRGYTPSKEAGAAGEVRE